MWTEAPERALLSNVQGQYLLYASRVLCRGGVDLQNWKA